MTYPQIEVAIGLVWKEGRLLIARRPEGVHLGGLWEFPGGKIEPGETPELCIRREMREELGIEICENCFAPLTFVSHDFWGTPSVVLLLGFVLAAAASRPGVSARALSAPSSGGI